MRSVLAFLLAFVAIVSALAIDKDFEDATKQLDDITSDDSVQLIPTDLGNDRQRLDIIVDGVYEGYLIETEDGGVQAFDENDKEIEIEDLIDADAQGEDGLEKRNRFRILIILAKVIKKFGAKAWRFIKCVGYTSSFLNCAPKFSNCAVFGHAPQECASGIICLGNAGWKCRRA
ncbi:hypothetical protein HJFPF1_12039 [Paramyrothecium foliicola]|nr:hypothetical protein HJFPF1_12039 [Paramyrothecium foliicola]